MKAPVRPGDTIAGKYEIERILAKGGMGIVVVARHLQLDKQVAIKFMLPELLSAGVQPDALERFVREGRAAVRLRGENVGRVLDVDTLPDGMPYMVMEYLEGDDLGRHVHKHGPLPLGESVDYVLQACVAMAEAHLAGVVHRDLKPSNLFLTRRPDGTPLIKVLDFGISKLYSDPGGGQTQTAVIMGSPSYMAPEQAQSARDADVRADIWSLGVILYECTSRQLPFAAQSSTAAILAQLVYEQPRPLAEVAPNLPAAFCQVVDHCLQKDPALRFQSIGELASALLPFASPVGRQAVASVHAIIGGAPATPGAPGTPGRASSQALAADSTDVDLPVDGYALQMASTDPVLAPPVASVARGAPVTPGASGVAGAAGAPGRASGARGGHGPGLRELDADAVTSARPLELAVDIRDPAVRRELTSRAPGKEPARTMFAPWRVWLTMDRVILVAAAAVLAALTATILISDAASARLDVPNAWIHRLGYELAGFAGRYVQILIGPAFQIAIPLVLAFVLRGLGRRLAVSVCMWWLGDNLVHIGRAIDEAPWQQITPITGDLQPWSHWLVMWRLTPHIDTIARVVYWAGAAIMIAVVLGLIQRLAGRR